MKVTINFIAKTAIDIQILIDNVVSAGFQNDNDISEGDIIFNSETFQSYLPFKSKKTALATLLMAEVWLKQNFKSVHLNPAKDSLHCGSGVAFILKG